MIYSKVSGDITKGTYKEGNLVKYNVIGCYVYTIDELKTIHLNRSK